ncbi:MAG: DUF2244 domain-containing protein [Sphingomonadaceae bacterium]
MHSGTPAWRVPSLGGDMPRDRHQEPQVWLLRRQCALSPRQFGLAYGVLCLCSFSVAALFVWLGVWQILLFTLAEMTAVAGAFLYHARHATDMERIELRADSLLVETRSAGRVACIRLEPWRTRVALPPRGLIALESNAQRILVGALVSEQRRRQFAQELRAALGPAQKYF